MAHTQKPDFVFWRNRWVHLNRQGRQFSRVLAAGVCASAVVMLDTPSSEVVWRVPATHSIRQFPPSLPLPCAIVCQLDSTASRSTSFTIFYFNLPLKRGWIVFQDKAKTRLNQILSVEESPLAVASAPGLLTPPPSSRKSIADHSVTLAGGLT